MNSPLVSVVIPCYNQGQYLMECITSVKNQTYRYVEIIVVNDGSTDSFTNELINNIVDSQINVINKKNGGLADARNAGIDSCHGEIVLPLDADDYIAPTYVAKAIEILLFDSDIGLVFCGGQYFGLKDSLMDCGYESFRSELLYNGIFCSALFRKKDYEHIGKYNLSMKSGYEDWCFWQRLIFYKRKVVQIPETLFFYRKHGESMLDKLYANDEAKTLMENVLFQSNIDIYINEWGSMIEILRKYEIYKNANISLNEAIDRIHDTFTYKLGNFILAPFKYVKKLVGK